MGQNSAERVALLSIRPQYAEAIFDGSKRVEFRRSRLATDISLILVYATKPVGRVVGWFQVGEIAEGTPFSLWQRFAPTGGIDRRSYLEYFDNARRAYGIEVLHPVRLRRPGRLDELKPGLRPPQSFQYLPGSAASRMLRRTPAP